MRVQWSSSEYITYYVTRHCTALHCTALHYTTLHYTRVHAYTDWSTYLPTLDSVLRCRSSDWRLAIVLFSIHDRNCINCLTQTRDSIYYSYVYIYADTTTQTLMTSSFAIKGALCSLVSQQQVVQLGCTSPRRSAADVPSDGATVEAGLETWRTVMAAVFLLLLLLLCMYITWRVYYVLACLMVWNVIETSVQ